MSLINQHLDIPARLRLRKTFARWSRNAAAFSADIKEAERVFDLVTKEGHKLEISRDGIPRAIKPPHLTLTAPELRRFHARVAVMDDDVEITRTKTHMIACLTRGFIPTVSADGTFTAVAPKREKRADPDWRQKAKDHRKFWARRAPAIGLTKLPSKIV